MAFVVSTPARGLRSSSASHRPSQRTRPTRHVTPHAVAAAVPRQGTSSSSDPPSRPRKRAPVMDSRIASVVESHHWISVKSGSRRLFERAAVAQTDMTRQVEQRTGTGSMHRWVLREVSDPTGRAVAVALEGKASRYVVMETFKLRVYKESPGVMKRWLSAVERVGPLVDTVDIRTRNYDNLFTTKLQDAQFDPNKNIVVLESVNVDMGRSRNARDLEEVMRRTAESSVAVGDCLEFCVLHAPGKQGFYKTIQVFEDLDALHRHLDTLDNEYARQVDGLIIGGRRNRQTFQPVVFS